MKPELSKYSNKTIAYRNARKYLGADVKIKPSTRKEKKYMVFDPEKRKWIHFGQMGYEDYTKHHDEDRRENYLARARNMEGDWKSDKYSANNLAINILW